MLSAWQRFSLRASAGRPARPIHGATVREENALGAAALQMIFGGLLMLAIAIVAGEWQRLR